MFNYVEVGAKIYVGMFKCLFFANNSAFKCVRITGDINRRQFLKFSFVLPTRFHKNIVQKLEIYVLDF